jgi:oligoribonuclease NrnB/cAMP/cGMP phosphodiesterase (DHH superfamily)
METWDKISRMTVEEVKEKGEGVRSYIDYYVRCALAEVQTGHINVNGQDYKVGVVNVPYTGVSEVGAAINEMGFDIGIGWFERGDGLIQFSFRSSKTRPEGIIDVSALATTLGGGGHQTAAGCQVTVERGRAIIDAILGRKINAI